MEELFWDVGEPFWDMDKLLWDMDRQYVMLIEAAVVLAFEKMRTPYTSGRDICVQKFRNVYERK